MPNHLVTVAVLVFGVVGCASDMLPVSTDAAVDLTVAPQAASCTSHGATRTCAVGEFCVSFEGGGTDCRALPDACLARATCACHPPAPNGTCQCTDDGAGRIVFQCH